MTTPNTSPSPASTVQPLHHSDSLAWWREARFGLFIHWGLYCIPAGEWKGRKLPGIGEWLMAQFKVPLAEYRECAKKFNPVHFDAEQIASLAAEAGMRYLVITAKHHEGFAMWDSQVSDYTIVKSTPYGKDPMKPLAEACARHGIKLCFYYSQALDWEHPDGGGNDWDFDPSQKKFQRYLDEKVKPQLRELLTGYGPIGLIWCDTPVFITREQSADLKRFIKSIQPDCLVSGRIGHGVGDYGSLGDNQIPAGRLQGDWETPATINDTWGYKSGDRSWKTTDTLLRLLIDLASKGVNYLLNIGPDAEGRVPQPSIDRLREIGAWMQINGGAVYGTQANPFPYEFDWGRITRKGNRLFLIFTSSPDPSFRLHGLENCVTSAQWIATGAPLDFSQSRDEASGVSKLHIHIGNMPKGVALPAVIALDLDGPPVADERCIQQPDGSILLPGHMAELHVSEASQADRMPASSNNQFAAIRGEEANETVGNHMSIGAGGLVERWNSERDSLSWTFSVFEPGRFEVRIHTVAAKYLPWVGGHEVEVGISGQTLRGEIKPDETIETPRTHLFAERATRLGLLTIDRAGEHRIDLRALRINRDDSAGLCVGELRLKPVGLAS